MGGVLSAIGMAKLAQVSEIGLLITNHPKFTTGIAAGVGTMLYAWALWTYSLWKKDNKIERVRVARLDGRQVCDCSEIGEIMIQTRDDIVNLIYKCPLCDSWRRISKPRK